MISKDTSLTLASGSCSSTSESGDCTEDKGRRCDNLTRSTEYFENSDGSQASQEGPASDPNYLRRPRITPDLRAVLPRDATVHAPGRSDVGSAVGRIRDSPRDLPHTAPPKQGVDRVRYPPVHSRGHRQRDRGRPWQPDLQRAVWGTVPQRGRIPLR